MFYYKYYCCKKAKNFHYKTSLSHIYNLATFFAVNTRNSSAEMNQTCNNSWPMIQRNSSLKLNDSSTSGNYSTCTESVQPDMRVDPYAAFYPVAFGSSNFIIVVSFTTVLANSFLLLTFYVDPLKTFRNPTTYFLTGLALVDLLTALVQEPIYATCFMLLYFRNPLRMKCAPFLDAGKYFAAFTMTVSFLIVFAFTVTQYIVVSSPLKYGRLVTNRKVLISVLAIYLHSTMFWCLHLMGVPENIQHMVDVFVHNYVLIFITIAIYILLHRVMRKKMAAGNSLQGNADAQARERSKHAQVQRNFVRVNFMLLAVLITCAVPTTVVWTIRLFTAQYNTASVKVLIGNLMVDNLLYLKFLLDPFVYAWRMPEYRQALKIVLRCGRKEPEARSKFSDRVMAEMSKSRDTVITLGLKSISQD